MFAAVLQSGIALPIYGIGLPRVIHLDAIKSLLITGLMFGGQVAVNRMMFPEEPAIDGPARRRVMINSMVQKAILPAAVLGFGKQTIVSHIAALTLLIGTITADAQIINTVAGNGFMGYNGDGMAATVSALNNPKGVAFDIFGNMYIADSLNHRIRRITTAGTISTFAGTGAAGYSGDGGPATAAMLNQPGAMAFDSTGNMIIADSQNRRIRKIHASSGIITTIAGTGTEGYSGDGGLAIYAMLHRAVDLAIDTSGNIYFADSVDNRIRKIWTGGIITTVAGTGVAGYSGDLGPATSAMLDVPLGVAVNGCGRPVHRRCAQPCNPKSKG